MRRRRRDVGPPVPAMLTYYEELDWRRAGDSPGAPFDRWKAARKTWGVSNPDSPLGDAVDRIRFERQTRQRLAGIAEGGR